MTKHTQLVADESATADRYRLIPPLAKEFSLSEYEGVDGRAREWALSGEHWLIGGASSCGHGIYGVWCMGCLSLFGGDHTDLWFSAGGEGYGPEVFLLTHPYDSKNQLENLSIYAKAHGLHLHTNERDSWYDPEHATGYRMTIAHGSEHNEFADRLDTLARKFPVKWPQEQFI